MTTPATSSRTSSRNSSANGSRKGWPDRAASVASGGLTGAAISVMAHEQAFVAEGDDDADDEDHHADRRSEADAHAGHAEDIQERDQRMGGVQRTAVEGQGAN